MSPAPAWVAQLDDVRRMLVLGCPGSGKTTLAARLRERTELPLVHLDDEFWGPGWRRTPEHEWVARQRELATRPEWIIEGNYLPTVPVRAERAAAAVVLDAPTATCVLRVVRRAARIRAGDLSALPAPVRDADPDPGAVRATADLAGLVRKILRFRRRDFWALLDAARSPSCTALVVVVVDRFPARRVAAVRRGLARRSWTSTSGAVATVVTRAEFDAALTAAVTR